jgi:hypothetical protein
MGYVYKEKMAKNARKMELARETIRKILQSPSLKVRRKGVVVKIIYPNTTVTPRDYIIALLNDKSRLFGYTGLGLEFAVNLIGDSSTFIGFSEDSYIVKPTVQDYLELWDKYTRYKRENGVDNKSNKRYIR